MSTGIGEILLKLREEAGYTQEQLCSGIYSVSELARIEAGRLVPGYFELDRLFGRLGKSTDKLEYVLPKEIYELYELQFKIQKQICHREFGKAKLYLKEYEEKKKAARPLHRQFIDQERAQIAWMEKKETEATLDLIHSAIGWTMSPDATFREEMALSAEELKLLLFRWEICKGTIYEREKKEVTDILCYADRHCTDNAEKAKVYPYAVLLICKEGKIEEEYDYLRYILQKALKMLQEVGNILFLPEMIELLVALLAYVNKDKNVVNQLKAERRVLLQLEKEYNIFLHEFRLFQCWSRDFELDYEVIQRSRQAVGIVQENLCDGICTQETLSRIENGKRSPNNRNFNLLLERLNRKRDRINTVIMTDDFEIIEMKRRYERYIQRIEYSRAIEVLDQLEKRLDLKEVKNNQYILAAKIKQQVHEKKISSMKAREELYTILLKSLQCEKENIFSHQLTVEEANILNYIAILYYEDQVKDKAIDIYRKLIKNYEYSIVHTNFHIREWGLQMSNLASCLEETGQLDEAMQVSKVRIQALLEVGVGSGLGRSLTTIACILEPNNKAESFKRFQQALCLLKLMKMDYRYELVKEYVDKHFS